MINSDALESSDENSLIVTNVIDVETLGSASTTASLELSSRTRFFLRKGKLLHPVYLIRR